MNNILIVLCGIAMGYETTITISDSGESSLSYISNFYTQKESDTFFYEIMSYPELNFTYYLIDNEIVQSPRRLMWCSDDLRNEYRFAANHVPGLLAYEFTPTLNKLRKDIEKITGEIFNSVLINLYIDGSEYSNWHSDNDPWLGDDFLVPSVSFGAERLFVIRPKTNRSNEQFVNLGHGSLILMEGKFQKEYEHTLPITTDCFSKVRINLTWRYVKPELRHLHNMKKTWNV